MRAGNVEEMETPKRTARDKVEASDDQLRRTPTGNLNHRIWTGECLEVLRQDKASSKDLALARTVYIEGHVAWEKGLMARPPLPKVQSLKQDTFH